MFAYKFQWKESGLAVGVAARRLNEIKRKAYTAAGELWQREFRPLHFTRQGARKYGYEPRSGEGKSGRAFWRSYVGRKQRHLRENQPLVKTGKSRDLAARKDVRARSTSTKSYVRIYIHAPALNFRNPHSKIDMRREITTVTQDEAEAMIRELDQVMQRELNALGK